eukprot:PhF_6_TR37084/c0_g1_i1/m.54367
MCLNGASNNEYSALVSIPPLEISHATWINETTMCVCCQGPNITWFVNVESNQTSPAVIFSTTAICLSTQYNLWFDTKSGALVKATTMSSIQINPKPTGLCYYGNLSVVYCSYHTELWQHNLETGNFTGIRFVGTYGRALDSRYFIAWSEGGYCVFDGWRGVIIHNYGRNVTYQGGAQLTSMCVINEKMYMVLCYPGFSGFSLVDREQPFSQMEYRVEDDNNMNFASSCSCTSAGNLIVTFSNEKIVEFKFGSLPKNVTNMLMVITTSDSLEPWVVPVVVILGCVILGVLGLVWFRHSTSSTRTTTTSQTTTYCPFEPIEESIPTSAPPEVCKTRVPEVIVVPRPTEEILLSQILPLFIPNKPVNTQGYVVLGSGKHGEVVLGEYQGTKVAIKLGKDESATKLVLNEYEMLCNRLSINEYCVRVLGKVVSENAREPIGFAMVYYPGGSLFDRYIRVSSLCPPIVYQSWLRYAICLCRGIEYAHENHVYHGDIKPQNMLVTDNEDTCVLSDFGLAVVGEDTYNPACGTAKYRSNRKQETNRSRDLHALAHSLLELAMCRDVPRGQLPAVCPCILPTDVLQRLRTFLSPSPPQLHTLCDVLERDMLDAPTRVSARVPPHSTVRLVGSRRAMESPSIVPCDHPTLLDPNTLTVILWNVLTGLSHLARYGVYVTEFKGVVARYEQVNESDSDRVVHHGVLTIGSSADDDDHHYKLSDEPEEQQYKDACEKSMLSFGKYIQYIVEQRPELQIRKDVLGHDFIKRCLLKDASLRPIAFTIFRYNETSHAYEKVRSLPLNVGDQGETFQCRLYRRGLVLVRFLHFGIPGYYELQKLSSIRHRNLVPIIGCEVMGNTVSAIITEYVDNVVPLHVLASQNSDQGLTIRKWLHAAKEVCEVLTYLHSFGISHGTVNAHNMYWTPDGTVFLSDLATQLSDSEKTSPTTKDDLIAFVKTFLMLAREGAEWEEYVNVLKGLQLDVVSIHDVLALVSCWLQNDVE